MAKDWSPDGFILDLDGTVYTGSRPIPGAAEAVAYLRAKGKRIVFLSNRGNISRRMCRERLEAIGIPCEAEDIILTSSVVSRYLAEHEPDARVWVLGEQGLRDELAAHGVRFAARPQEADRLVVTLHETLTYAELNDAFRAVRAGARIIATNADRTFPGEDGEAIDVGGLLAALTHTTGTEVDTVVGKPSPLMAEAALDRLGLPPERCMVIGDSLASDIAMGRRMGLRTALVLTGSATREAAMALDEAERPDWILDSLADIRRLLEEMER
ncbi:haloacid dehalogenase superfamily enzyme, subfamily IA [Thermobacillus composti KWC4]|uniref:Acid sugar phosphatase n=1 Tax=Thermobacillus composti (strain DSM 18247 / JCM 13945 / KWC4) TaxID=717605 RepID=L0EJC4_THECK|nr:HAD-IIA family hydrolase [Thermobacillus composti]AGA59295.1 haloacid dehalogenase superfamily enzyme, subfamily IA [Thermobacillus composti KWC4]